MDVTITVPAELEPALAKLLALRQRENPRATAVTLLTQEALAVLVTTAADMARDEVARLSARIQTAPPSVRAQIQALLPAEPAEQSIRGV